MKHSYLIYHCTGYLRKIMKFKFYVITVCSHLTLGTSVYNGQFHLSLRKANMYCLLSINPINTDSG